MSTDNPTPDADADCLPTDTPTDLPFLTAHARKRWGERAPAWAPPEVWDAYDQAARLPGWVAQGFESNRGEVPTAAAVWAGVAPPGLERITHPDAPASAALAFILCDHHSEDGLVVVTIYDVDRMAPALRAACWLTALEAEAVVGLDADAEADHNV